MKLPILTLGILVAAVLVGYFVRSGGEDDRQPLEPEDSSPDEVTPEPEDLPLPLQPDPDATGGATPPVETDPAPEVGGESPGPTALDTQALLAQRDWEILQLSFEERYGQLNVSALREELAKVEQAIQDQRKILFEDRFARGIYDIQVLGAPPISPPDPGPRGRLPVQDSQTFSDPTTLQTEAHIATLPLDEYPEFYELLDERDWLKSKIGD